MERWDGVEGEWEQARASHKSPSVLGGAVALSGSVPAVCACGGASLSGFLDVKRCGNPCQVMRVVDGPRRCVFPEVALVPAYTSQRGGHVHHTWLELCGLSRWQ